MPSLVESGQVVLKKIYESFQCVCTKSLSSSPWKGHGLKFEQISQYALFHDWLKLAQWFWRGGFSKVVIQYSFTRTVSLFSLLGKGRGSSLKNSIFLYSKMLCACQVWLKLVQWFRRKRIQKCEKFTTTKTDKFCSEKLTRVWGAGGQIKGVQSYSMMFWIKVNIVEW